MAANIMRIVPLTVMESESRQIAAVQAARLAAAPLETRIHVLSYVKAADVAPIFSQLLSPRGRLMVEPRLNMIIIKDVAP
jgi:type II secretory pathway component HofQ